MAKEIKRIILPPSTLPTERTPNDQAVTEFLDENSMHITDVNSYGEWITDEELAKLSEEDIYALAILQNCVTCGQVIGNFAENCKITDDNDLHPLRKKQAVRYWGE